jgi:hypothetical protein
MEKYGTDLEELPVDDDQIREIKKLAGDNYKMPKNKKEAEEIIEKLMYKGTKTMGNRKNLDDHGDGIQGMAPLGKRRMKRFSHHVLRQRQKAKVRRHEANGLSELQEL